MAARLRGFPNTAIGVVLGIGGHAVMWRNLAGTPFTLDVLGDSAKRLNWFFWVSGLVTFAITCGTYAAKAACCWDVVVTEYRHPVRAHFCNGPTIAMLMLALGAPPEAADEAFLRGVWVLCLALQVGMTQQFYARWLFSDSAFLSNARPPYLLSTVGWFLLAVLGNSLGLDGAWHLPLPAWCFGSGAVMYALVVIAVFLGIHEAAGEKGQPAFLLLIAPSSVAAMALAGFNGGVFGTASSALMGYNFTILAVLVRLGPQLCAKPKVFGTYWSYVFPLAALATCAVRYAATGRTDEESGPTAAWQEPAKALAWLLVGLATLMLLVVFCRTTLHHVMVLRGAERWGDPLVDAMDAAARATADAPSLPADGDAQRGAPSASDPHVAQRAPTTTRVAEVTAADDKV